MNKTKRQTKQQKLQQQSTANAAQNRTRGEVTARDPDVTSRNHDVTSRNHDVTSRNHDVTSRSNDVTPRDNGVVGRGLAEKAREELRVREGTLVLDVVNKNIDNSDNRVNNSNTNGVVNGGAHVRSVKERPLISSISDI